MRRMLTALAVAGALLAGLAAATPAVAKAVPFTLLCSTGTNDATLVNGVCVLPTATAGQPYEAFILTSNNPVDTFTITSGSLPPGLSMPATYGAAGTIVGGTPTAPGTYTFSVHVTPFGAGAPSANGTYSITVAPPPPLTITFPATCCNSGTVGSAYLQNFFSSGGTAPFAWTMATGRLPSGVTLTGNHLSGTPTTAGTSTFTIKITDSAGGQATEAGTVTITR